MREITLKTISNDGQAIEESKITIKEGETLVVQPAYEVSIEDISNLHRFISDTLKDSPMVVTLPHGIEFKILKVE